MQAWGGPLILQKLRLVSHRSCPEPAVRLVPGKLPENSVFPVTQGPTLEAGCWPTVSLSPAAGQLPPWEPAPSPTPLRSMAEFPFSSMMLLA